MSDVDVAELVNVLHRVQSSTSNEERSQLESSLDQLKKSDQGWKKAEFLLTQSDDPLLLHFALSIIDFWALKRWQLIPKEDRNRLRDSISNYTIQQFQSATPYVLKKAVKVYVSIGKVEWPHDNPDFFSAVSSAAQSPETTQLGVYMLRAISEDFTPMIDNDVSSTRKKELRELLTNEAPTILSFLVSVLSSHLANWDDSKVDETDGCLQTLCHYLSWLPLDASLCVDNLFDVLFGCLRVARVAGGSLADSGTLVQSAFSCLIELFSKNYVPSNFQAYLISVFSQLCQLIEATLSRGILHEFDDDSMLFSEECNHFVYLILVTHINRIEEHASDLVLPFLKLFLSFTIQQRNEGFRAALEAWSALFDHVATRHTQLLAAIDRVSGSAADAADENAQRYVNAYRGAVQGLAEEIRRRMSYTSNGDELVELEACNEQETFIEACCSALSQLASISSDDVPLAVATWCDGALRSVALDAHNPPDDTRCGDARLAACAGAALAEWYAVVAAVNGSTRQQLFDLTQRVGEQALALTRHGVASGWHLSGGATTSLLASLLTLVDSFCIWWYDAGEGNAAATGLMALVTPLLMSEPAPPSNLARAAAILFRKTITVCKPSEPLSIEPLRQLLENYSVLSDRLDTQARDQLATGCGAALLMVDETTSSSHYNEFITQLCAPVFSLDELTRTKDALNVACVLCEAATGAAQSERKRVSVALEPVLAHCLVILPQLLSEPVVASSAVQLIAIATDALRGVLDSAFATAAANTLLSVFGDASVLQQLIEATGVTATLLIHLLNLLTRVASEPKAAKDGLAGNSLLFVAKQFWPALSTRAQSDDDSIVDIMKETFELLYTVSLSHWRWLTPGNSGVVRNQIKSPQSGDEAARQECCDAVLSTFVNALSVGPPSVSTVRCVVAHLDSLNGKVNLFKLPLFASNHAAALAIASLNLIVDQQYSILHSSLLSLLCELARTDLEAFATGLLPLFLQQCQGIDDSNARSLLETATQSLARGDIPSITDGLSILCADVARLSHS